MTTQAVGLVVRSMDEPDERREPPLARADVTSIPGATITRVVAQPGWRWSVCVSPIAGTPTCQVPHSGYVVSGRLGILMDDGAEGELSAGDAFYTAPGHDGWVIGDEPAVFLEVTPAATPSAQL